MRAAILRAPGGVALTEIDTPAFGAGDCVIRVHTAAICSTDAREFQGQTTRLRLGVPPILGHEVFGHIVSGGATGLAEGRPVAVVGTEFCRGCRWCRRREPLLCSSFRITAGGYAGILVVPADWSRWRVWPLPADADPAGACFFDSLACAARAMRIGRVSRRAQVLVIGSGFMAALTAEYARWLGADTRIVTRSLDRAGVLRTAGFDARAEDGAWPEEWSSDVVIDTSGRARTLGIDRYLGRGTRVVVMSGHSGELPASDILYTTRSSIAACFHSDMADRATAAKALPVVNRVAAALSVGVEFGRIQQALNDVATRSLVRCHVRVGRD